jgi:hypothetical protein
VFVSYVHESPRHRDDVLAFAAFLRSQGVDAVLDLWAADARHDWYAWALREMTAAAYVIVVASPGYRAVGDGGGPADRHRGARSEAALLRELVYGDRDAWTPKVLPVLLPGHAVDEIPRFLSPHTTSRFEVAACTVTGAEELLRVIHRSPGHVPPPVLAPPELRPRPVPAAWEAREDREEVVWCAAVPGDLGLRADSVEVHLVPGERVGPHPAGELRRTVAELAAATADVVRSDPSGAVAWVAADGAGFAVLRTGQRSAWFTPSGALEQNGLAAAVEERLALLAAAGPRGATAWLPAIGAGPVRIVPPGHAIPELRPGDLAARLAADLLARLRPVSTTTGQVASQVTNQINGNVHGTVLQAGDIRGGVHF